ncbi:MAG: hypothetical protein AAFR61_09340 [Bacteroidota bacterium]
MMWTILLTLCLSLASQPDFPLPEKVAYLEIPVYPHSTTMARMESGQVALQMAYARYHIQNPEALSPISAGDIFQVDLVFTKYPKDTTAWRTNYTFLLQSRLRELYQLKPALFARKDLTWRYILQTEPETEPEAMDYFHGLVLHWKKQPDARLDSVLKFDPAMTPIADIILGNVPKLKDSSAFWILDRHPEWQDKLVIMDWTASMYQNRASVLNWHRRQVQGEGIQHVVLFNDGNRTPHLAKRKGKTGGIYHIEPDTLEAVIEMMAQVKARGLGGDPAENDIEAILKATRSLDDFGEVILLPDRNSSVRDISLVGYLKHPVRIILFRGKKTRQVGLGSTGEWVENTWVHPHYLTLACLTQGSIHLHNRDIDHLHEMKAGEKLKIGQWEYEKQANQTFKALRFK